jgi:hypothetical protein
MSVKKGGEWEEASEGLAKLDVAGLDLAWETLKVGLVDAKGVLDGRVRPEDSKFASPGHVTRIVDATEQVRGAVDEIRMFLLDVMIEIVRKSKQKEPDR